MIKDVYRQSIFFFFTLMSVTNFRVVDAMLSITAEHAGI